MFLHRLRNRGVAMICYAVLLAFITGIGGLFMSDKSLSGAIEDVIDHVRSVVQGGSPNGEPLTDNDRIGLAGQTELMYEHMTAYFKQKNILGSDFSKLVALELNYQGRISNAWYEDSAGNLQQLESSKIEAAKNHMNGKWGQMQDKKDVKYNTTWYADLGSNSLTGFSSMFVAYNNNGKVTGKVTGYSGETYDSIADRNTEIWFRDRKNSSNIATFIYNDQYSSFEKYPYSKTK